MMPSTTRLLGSNSQYSRYPLERFFTDMGALGVHRLDFLPQTPHFFLSHTGYESPDCLKAALDKAHLQVGVLTPPPYRYSIAAPAGMQRDATLGYYKNAIELAAALGADRLVLGASGACWDIDRESLLHNCAEFFAVLCPVAAAAGITLLLVPVMGADAPLIAESPVLGTVEELAAMVVQVGHPALGVCLDTNVMSVNGDSIPQWFSALGAKTQLVRLCDGNYHGYRAWGEGVLPMERYWNQLNEAGYRGEISLVMSGERYLEHPDYPQRVTKARIGEGTYAQN